MPAPDHLDELLFHLQCFSKDQRKKDKSDSKPDSMPSFQKTPASHWRLNTYSALSFEDWDVDWDVDFAFPDFNPALFE